ncbi:MAG TPA: hypothetical protein ENF70_03005 [Deltaproteobacteria bacterium]|nr:hypothetical protein [Deltaproteobacteria bacterium]
MIQEDIEKWLKKNTFQCPLGRVSLRQCEANRNRPTFGKALRRRRWTLFKPLECENCTVWKNAAKPKDQRMSSKEAIDDQIEQRGQNHLR